MKQRRLNLLTEATLVNFELGTDDIVTYKVFPRSRWWKFRRWILGFFGEKIPNNVMLPGEPFKVSWSKKEVLLPK